MLLAKKKKQNKQKRTKKRRLFNGYSDSPWDDEQTLEIVWWVQSVMTMLKATALSFFFFWPRGIWNLSSLTRDPAHLHPHPTPIGRAESSPLDHQGSPPCTFLKVKVKPLVALLSLTLCSPIDCSPPGFSVHGILQARLLKWAAIPFSRRSSQPRDWTWLTCIAGAFFTVWATREAHSFKW